TFTTTNGANAGFLHIDPSAATQIQGGGVPITGITDDYDGDARNATTPDIGADEFTGSNVDFIPPTINYTAFVSTSLTTNRTLNATITDPSMIAGGANSPRIYFKKNSGPYFSTQCSGTYACTIDYSLIGGVAVGDVISYFVIAQDVPGNVGANPGGGLVAANVNSVTRPPTVPNTYSIIAAIASSVDVGAGQTFTSLSNNDAGGIFNAINNGVLDRNVTINITSDLTTETGAVAMNQWNEDGAGGYSVTIKPAGAARIITGNSTNSVIRLNGADNVTIDGSLTGGTAIGVGGNSSLRNLTIQNTNTSATAGAVVAVMQGANSANNITIKNTIVSGQDPTQTLAGIHVGGNTVGASPSMRSNNNIVIDNCAFKRTTVGIFDNGASVEAAASGSVISHNDLTATGPDRLRRVGILFFNQNAIRVSENAIGGITDDEGIDAIGIAAGIQNVTTTTTTSGGVFNAIISKNKISGVTSTNAAGLSAAGIAIAGDPTAGNFISNNMISGVLAPSISPDIVAGIFVSGVAATNTHLFYNSVSMSGNRGGASGQGASYGLAISGANPTIELKNNILYNSQTSSGGADARSYAIGIGTSAFTNLSSNFNDFFTSGANSGRFRTGSLDTDGTDLPGLDVWQSATSGDANSLSDDPLFVNPVNDPHLSGISPAVNAGTVLGAINDDIDGQSRGGQPDMGADEVFTGSIQFSAISYTVPEAGPTAILTVKRIGGTDGSVSVDYATSNGTATGGAMCGGSVDYVNTSGTITFAGGDGADKTINVPICNDSAYEGNETFNTTLSNATGGATIGMTASASIIIADDETVPSVQFSSDTYSTVEAFRSLSSEGVPGATINITLSGASQSNVTVHYATNNGTATGGAACTAGVDYLSVSGTATIVSGQTSTSFFVPTCADTVVEEDETVTLLLSGPSVATLGTPSLAILTILDTDVAMPGSLQLSSPTYSIGEAGGMATITVGRTGGSSGAVGVSFATSNGTATGGMCSNAGVDYVTTSGTLMWADGDTANKTFTIQICNDLIPEPNETVNIALSNVTGGASIGTPSNSVLTIVNDDVPGTLSVSDVRVWEGNSGTVNASFSVTCVGQASPVSVHYATANGTAAAGSDYISTSGTLTFNAPPVGGSSVIPTQTQNVTVQVIGDTNKEENETFFLNLSSPVNAVIADGQGVGIINDDDRTFVSDFDHDLKSDLSVFRPSEGAWYVLQTSDAMPKIVSFGNSTDRPVPGDYDGDGRVDYAVWRESTGNWLIKLSSDDSERSVDWGLPGDKPVQGDY
ncbi:MAG TPA: Calx-beta domain-containing protein, partial [Pyrinomonadaceae bacterium]|nr:Calx-beta domain-containing protein [Pyrinomonadaceae bacterium]